MFQFFDVIQGFLETIVNFFSNIIGMITYVITFCIQGFAYVMASIVYMPEWVLPFVTAVIGFSVIMFIINR